MNSVPRFNQSQSVPPRWQPNRRQAAGILATFFLVTLLAIFGYERTHRPVKPVEVPRSDLVLRDGRLYRTNGSLAFTGVMIERFDSGLLKSRSSVVDGRLQGLSEGWHTNGQRQVIEHFQAGISDGPRIKFYPSGQKESEGRIVAGNFNGTYRRWHENGHLAEQIEFHSGHPEGVALAYFETGFVKTRARMRSGVVVERQTWKDGEIATPPEN
jgi:antitoxin component YwqK of YwqJK toxin-antitoxin module